ncbi:DUF4064 domain-containing protein [Gemella cuniculi]|uniref:DUF4064 domain-containing protein n=1 Tax=Gemella cuniculi TaxID=150240 RepID=UPI0003FF0CA8|nr:DUF4064 domain-containing protein [Gemella cuniculi]
MREFNRTVEKVLAWIANIFLIIITSAVSYIAFSGKLGVISKDPEFLRRVNAAILENGQAGVVNVQDVTRVLEVGFRGYAIFYIVFMIMALIASFTMKSRIVSGVMFLIVAIAVGVTSIGIFVPIYLLHFIVAIMLFVRKEPVTMDENPYSNGGYNSTNGGYNQNSYGQAQNQELNSYNQNVNGTNYQTNNTESKKDEPSIDKIEYL